MGVVAMHERELRRLPHRHREWYRSWWVRGPVLAAWSRDLRLSNQERQLLRRALDGSAEQGALLEALDGPIDETRARRFAAAFLRVTERALGKARTGALVTRATNATWAG